MIIKQKKINKVIYMKNNKKNKKYIILIENKINYKKPINNNIKILNIIAFLI